MDTGNVNTSPKVFHTMYCTHNVDVQEIRRGGRNTPKAFLTVYVKANRIITSVAF